MVREERHSEEEVRRVCVEIRRQAALENARWQLKAGYGGLALMSVVLVVVLWGGDSWRWWWLFYFVAPVMLVINGHRVARGKNRGEINGKIKGGAQLMGRLLFCRRFIVQKIWAPLFCHGFIVPAFPVPLLICNPSSISASPAFRPSPFRCARGLLRIIPFSSPRRPYCRPCRLPSRSP